MARMGSSIVSPSRQRQRRHGAALEPDQRRELERSGWRTTLDFRENHVRGLDGRLLRVESVWIAEAERFDGQVEVASAEGATADEAWNRLGDEIAVSNTRVLRRVRLTF